MARDARRLVIGNLFPDLKIKNACILTRFGAPTARRNQIYFVISVELAY